MFTTVNRRRYTRTDTGKRADDLAIVYGCGDWESLLNPSDFPELAEWHRRICPACS